MAIVLGLVQGVAEFLPISSSGHLSLLQSFFGMEEPDALYNILLHFATLLAVCVVYRGDIADMVVEFFRGIAALFGGSGARERGNPPEARRLVLLLILGTLPLFLVLPIEDFVEELGANPVFVSVMLLVTGCILYLSDRYGGGRKNGRTATVKDVLLVGLAQGAATIPGLSRSGTTISAGMALGFERNFAVRFSFLLSLPAVLGATLLKVVKVAGGVRYGAAPHVPHRNGGGRGGGLFLHLPGEAAGQQGQVRHVCLLLLDCRGRRPGRQPPSPHPCPRGVT